MYAIRHTLDISQEPDIQYTSTPYLDLYICVRNRRKRIV